MNKRKLVTIAALLGSAMSAQAQVADLKGNVPYAVDMRGTVVRSGYGLCWRTAAWTPQMAQEVRSVGSEFPVGCACDKDLLPKDKCEAAPPAPAPVKSEPPPPPAPVRNEPPPPPPAAAKPITLASKALFAFNKATLTPEGKANIDKEVVAKLGDVKKITFVLVTGHTDRLGSQQYNQKLSEKRAEAVKAYLVSKGLDAEIVETMGAGKTQPVPGVSCSDKLPRKKLIECLEPNRRVTVEIKADPK